MAVVTAYLGSKSVEPDYVGTDVESYLQHQLGCRDDWVLLYADLRYFRTYNQFYGFLAGEQMLRAFHALLLAQLPPDCACVRIGGDEFLALSTKVRAEADARSICERWKQIRPHFYRPADARRGFLVGNARHGIGCRFPLVRVCIGLVDCTHYPDPLASIADICSAALATNALARCQRQSVYVTEHQLHQALNIPHVPSPAQQTALHLWLYARDPGGKVLVIEPDAALACLLQMRLELDGYSVWVSTSVREATESFIELQPDVVIVAPDPPISTCQYLRSTMTVPDMLLVAIANDADRVAVLEAGADLYLPKPFELTDLLYWIERLRQSHLKSVDAAPYTAKPYATLPKTARESI